MKHMEINRKCCQFTSFLDLDNLLNTLVNELIDLILEIDDKLEIKNSFYKNLPLLVFYEQYWHLLDKKSTLIDTTHFSS